MNNRKKGFTLIELLAVIVILAIIALVAIPLVLNIAEKSKIKAMKANELMVTKAAETYLASGLTVGPAFGETLSIPISDLQSEGYLKKFSYPKDASKSCSGYVLITNKGDDGYNYEPNINCFATVDSSADENLALHLSMDDIVEPATNLWGNGYNIYNNYGVPATITELDETYEGAKVYRLTMTVDDAHSSALSSFRTGLYSHGVYSTISNTFLANTEYAASIYWRPVNKKDVYVGGTASNIGGWISAGNEGIADGWSRYTAYRSGSVTEDRTDRVFMSFRSPSLELNESVSVDFCAPQIEEGRIYPTKYTDSTRIGSSVNYGNANLNGTFELGDNPLLSEDAISGTSYSFDGVDDYIRVTHDASLMPESITVSTWIKFDESDGSSWMAVNKAPGGTSGSYYIYGSGSGANMWGTWSIFGPSGTRYNADFPVMPRGEWLHLAGTFDHITGDQKSYLNGELINTVENAELGSNTADVLIGKYTADYEHNGNLDDVRIYGRALSDEEVKYLYEVKK